MVALGYPGAKISLKEDVVPTFFPAVEAMLMPPIRRTSTTTVHLGSKRAVSELSSRIQVMSAQGEFGQHFLESSAWNSGNVGLRAQWSLLSLPKRLCSEHMKFNVCLTVNEAYYLLSHLIIDFVPH